MKFFFIALLAIGSVPTHNGYVTDIAGMLTPDQRQTILTQLVQYEQRTTNEIAILIIPSLDGDEIAPYANRVFHSWGIGKKDKNNGVLFVWATKERKVRIEVGYGLEPIIPDGRSGQIIRETITPQFRLQRWYEGVSGGVTAIIAQLDRNTVETVTPVPSSDSLVFIIVIIVVVIAIFAVILFLIFREKDESGYWSGTSSYDSTLPSRNSAYRSSRRSSSYSSSSSSGWFDSGGSSGSSNSESSTSIGSFGGGDSGGGGADGSY